MEFSTIEWGGSNDTLAYEDDSHKVNLCTFGPYFNFCQAQPSSSFSLAELALLHALLNHLKLVLLSWAELTVI